MEWPEIARRLAADPDDSAALAALAAPPPLPDLPAPPDPPGLAAPDPPEPPTAWHARRLAAGVADPLARHFHARWLAHLLRPDDPAALPRVSVVTTTFDRCEEVQQAIDSVLAQDWPAVEMVVVDDASRDDTVAVLRARYGARIRLVPLAENGGISVARNAGIAAATGEFVHFLDSDDRLLPGCLSLKVAAFAARPQAGLCLADMERAGPAGSKRWNVRAGAPNCASRNAAYGLIARLLTLPSCVMLPRHVIHAVGGFDERLRQHDDRHFFGKLGLAGTVCVALDRPLTWMRLHESSLSRRPDGGHYGVLVGLMLLEALLGRPDLWPMARGPVAIMFWGGTWARFEAEPAPLPLGAFERLLAGLSDLAAGRLSPELSPAPLAADLADSLDRIRAAEPGRGPLADRLDAALAACRAARPPGPADLALWRAQSFDPAFNAPAFRLLFRALGRSLRAGRSWLPLAELDRRPMRAIPHPAKRRWRLLARVSRGLGEGTARRLARVLG